MKEKEGTNKETIVPPKGNKKRGIFRAILEGTIEIVPGGGIATNFFRETLPPKSDSKREEWRQAISLRSNEHETRLNKHENIIAPSERVSGIPAVLISALAHDCPDGLGQKYYRLDDIVTLLPNENKEELEEAVFDVEALGLLNIYRSLNSPWNVKLTTEFYEQVDHQVMGWDTEEDAHEIAQLMLSESTGDAPTLHKKLGWEKRRFNPAFRHLLPMFPDGRVRKSIQPDYPSLGVVLTEEDKANLRRFLKGSGTREA